MHVCIFEGIYFERLLPLTYFRPTYELRCGITSLKDKILRHFPNSKVTLHCRSYLADFLVEKNPEYEINFISSKECLFVNGRVLAEEGFLQKLDLTNPNDVLFVNGETIVAAKVSGEKLENLKSNLHDLFTLSDFDGLIKKQIDVKMINYYWDLVNNNPSQIAADYNFFTKEKKKKLLGKIYQGTYLLNENEIFVDEGASVKPGVVLDAELGPIFIGKGAKLMPNAVIEGPCFIGENSVIKIGAKIYEGTSIGEVCKVGGEVENSIIHSHSNKQHEGFLGHSYLAMWVNLGADTNNSDLKNNYGSVKVFINGELVDTGSLFVGLSMGDHSKCAINTMFNTGTNVGVSCNIYGAGVPPKYMPSFSWGGGEMMTTYALDRSLDVAKRVMGRRKITMSPAEEKLFRKVFDLTREERRKRGMPN
ncbi:MAG: glucose-1-phosphate thymidylyltransferase [Ignavibacteria bacterium]|nr:glucose-1-phosphate thymidylyltransferase [Ignavibacteria bacterium]